MQETPWQLVRLVGTVAVLGPPVAYYVYRRERERGAGRALLSAVGYGLLGPVGLFAYLYRRGDFAPSSDEEA